MILPALVDYYQRLEKDTDQQPAPFGFSHEKIHFCVVLEPDGTLASNKLSDLREQVIVNEKTGKTRIAPRSMLVPSRGGRSGAGFKPFFLWDNTGYVLGRDGKDNSTRSEQAFEEFREFHLKFRDQIQDESFQTVCRFLQNWQPSMAESLENWEEACGLNVVFQVRGQTQYVHQIEQVKQAWLPFASKEIESHRGRSLITGAQEDIAQLHPQIGGVAGAQTTGAAIVSFNLSAFTSYGKTQSYNAPVGVHDAHRYTTALQHLLTGAKHRIRIGDATVVFWSDKPTLLEDIFGGVISEEDIQDAEDAGTTNRVKNFLSALRRGKAHEGIDQPDVPFYILGLSPNASRIHVRFWLTGTVREFAKRLDNHIGNLEIIGQQEGKPPLVVRKILLETAREAKGIPPQLAGELTRAILTGQRYPTTLLSAVVRRIRASPDINYRRAAIIKAVLIRNHNMEINVSLNKDYPDPAYHLGRLFAALDKTQEDARLSRTIKDGYFSAASATPASVFSRLMRMHQHHLKKLEYEGQKIKREQLVQEICSHVQDFPAHLPLKQQGLFDIGYYHQRQDFFTKTSTKEESTQTQDMETTQ